MWGPCLLYSFPRATVTHYHKQGGLKQQKCILLVLKAGSPKSRCWQGHGPSKCLKRIPPCLSGLWGLGDSLTFLGLQVHLSSLSSVFTWTSSLRSLLLSPVPTFAIGFNMRWPYCEILNLILSAKTLFPNNATFTNYEDWVMDFVGGAPFRPHASFVFSNSNVHSRYVWML